MSRCVSSAIRRPNLRVTSTSFRGGLRSSVSTKSGAPNDGRPAVAKMPRLTHRMRRLARAHPEAVAAISPTAVEQSRSAYAARTPDSQRHQHQHQHLHRYRLTPSNKLRSGSSQPSASGTKSWTNADLGTPEFFQWLNTIPANAAERLAEFDEEEEREGVYSDEDDDDEASGDGPLNVGKMFLIPRAKTSLYDVEIFSSSLLEARDKVLGARSPGQLRKAHDRLRETENALKLKADNYNTVKVGFEEPPPSAASTSAPREESLVPQQTTIAQGKNKAASRASRVVYGPSETFAYVYHRMMPAYTVVHRVLTELKGELSDFNPRSMLDFGSGPGTAALAVWDVWGMKGGTFVEEDGQESMDEGSMLSEVRMVEESQSMRDACNIMLEPMTSTGRVRTGFGTSLLEEARAAGRGGPGGAPGGKKFDLVVAAYSLSDLPTHASRAAATAVMWSLVAPGGTLVLVEDGSAKGSHTVRSARQMVLRPSSPSSEQGKDVHKQGSKGRKRTGKAPPPPPYVVGPCRHDMECPLQTGEFCRFRQKVPWNANVTSSAVKSLAFSYATIRKGPPVQEISQSEGNGGLTSSSSADLLRAFLEQQRSGEGEGSISDAMDSLGTDGISDATLKRDDWARLIRKPLKSKGHALLDVCTPAGNIQRKAVAKGKWKGVPGVYVAARKSQLGGLWPYLDDHDVKDHSSAKDNGSNVGQEDDLFELSDSESDDGNKLDLDGWDDDGGSEWEPAIDLSEGRKNVSGNTRRVGRRRQRGSVASIRPMRGFRSSKDESEVRGMLEENISWGRDI